MKHTDYPKKDKMQMIINSRKAIVDGANDIPRQKSAEEGGCGVVGFASSVPVRGRHIFEPSIQMHNRGNGKGGGIACACLNHEQLGVDQATLRNDYILQIALLDPSSVSAVEEQFINPHFKIDHRSEIQPAADWQELGTPIKPPDVIRYFVRCKENVLRQFADTKELTGLPVREIEDEFVYQNSAMLNQQFYASLGDKRAFVLSHARDLMIFKIVGYAEHVVQYYGLDDFQARVWIAHQRYPTKGRVWHPAGSHPFIGMNEALVHNGDFANYYSVSEYLRQHNIIPQFLTDTEVSVQLFDLWSRIYKYPLEYVIEALAPTPELDFDRLPREKQDIYKLIHALHIHGSPDGPWFFIIANSNPDVNSYNLLGITDTAMLRPQVFALQEGDVNIGLVASEKQAIDATLDSLSREDSRFRPVADRYWNARGGSHTDGGAFSFNIKFNDGNCSLTCQDKFGKVISAPSGEYNIDPDAEAQPASDGDKLIGQIKEDMAAGRTEDSYDRIVYSITSWNLNQLNWLLKKIVSIADISDEHRECTINLLTRLNDLRYDCGTMRRSSILHLLRISIDSILSSVPLISRNSGSKFTRIDWQHREHLRPQQGNENILVIYASDFPPEGDECDARLIVRAYELGWRQFILYGLKGQRFHGCGFGPQTDGVRIDIYGSSGDYIASGIDGMEIHIHNNGQDQIGQIMKTGHLVVYGDVGQAFMYGAKGGEVYIMGNAAGRPLINAVGRPRVVINGTCLDFLAESFMAGDPHKGGGFVIVNGIEFDDRGNICDQISPYPGSNLFSLASGGAIYVRDPDKSILEEQLNGGEFAEFTDEDWALIVPYLIENERLFGISIERDLLTINNMRRSPGEIYRKVRAVRLAVLAKVEVPE